MCSEPSQPPPNPCSPQELQCSPLPSVRNNLIVILTDLCVRYTAPHVPYISTCLLTPSQPSPNHFSNPQSRSKQELQRSSLPSVRNNLVIILTDLCVRYTALVDPHVPCISACLRDPCELVRRQTLVLLAGLLQRDYVKWRGALSHVAQISHGDDLRVTCTPLPPLLQLLHKERSLHLNACFRCPITPTLATQFTPLHPSPPLSTSLHPSTGRVPLVPYNIFIEALFALNACPFAPSSTTTAPSHPYSPSFHLSPPLSTPLHPSTGRVPLVPYNIFIEALFALNACPFAPSSTTTAPPLPSSGPRPSSSSPPNPGSANPGSTNPSSSNPGSSKAAPCDPSQPNCPNSSSPVEGIHGGFGWPGKRGGQSGRGTGVGREGLDEELERFSLR
ncbi:unnamed protein product [Closterium sp. NIES-54]